MLRVRYLGLSDRQDLNQERSLGIFKAIQPGRTIPTKGLEFDAVIVANPHKDNFNESEFDRMLLYLACTRARHHLEIHWYGTRSAVVPDNIRLIR